MTPGLTIEEVLRLPAMIDLPAAGRALGIGRTKSYELATSGDFPCPVRRIGAALRVAKADLMKVLSLDAGPVSGG